MRRLISVYLLYVLGVPLNMQACLILLRSDMFDYMLVSNVYLLFIFLA
jgi:hypothetical protein